MAVYGKLLLGGAKSTSDMTCTHMYSYMINTVELQVCVSGVCSLNMIYYLLAAGVFTQCI